MTALSKEAQIAEAQARQESGLVPGETAQALDVVDDGANVGGAEPAQRTAPGAEPAERVTPPTRGAFEDKRAAIINRFRSTRTEEVADQTGDISEFARSGMPPEFQETTDQPGEVVEPVGDQPGDVVVDDAAPAAAALPQMVKIKVLGVEKEMPLDEALAAAQKSLAADDYLGEARALLAEAKTVRRSDQPGHHAGEQPGHHANAGAQPDATTAASDPPNQEDPLAKLIDTLQFGDPAEAKALLKSTLSSMAQEQVTTALQTDRLKDEGARTAKVLSEFESQNPEIASDELARAVIERKVLNLQVEDIRALGVDPAQLQMSVADAHRWYRAQGYKVRTPADMLTTAVDQYKTWKGGAPTQQAQPKQGAPRIEVNVDRTARRQAIPQQPSRTVAPKPGTQGNAPQPRDRSSIVEQMRQKRVMPRNGVIVS